jgi:hypothetical protein
MFGHSGNGSGDRPPNRQDIGPQTIDFVGKPVGPGEIIQPDLPRHENQERWLPRRLTIRPFDA